MVRCCGFWAVRRPTACARRARVAAAALHAPTARVRTPETRSAQTCARFTLLIPLPRVLAPYLIPSLLIGCLSLSLLCLVNRSTVGEYKTTDSNAACTPCSTISSTLTTAATKSTLATHCVCQAGYSGSTAGAACTACPVGASPFQAALRLMLRRPLALAAQLCWYAFLTFPRFLALFFVCSVLQIPTRASWAWASARAAWPPAQPPPPRLLTRQTYASGE